jgi:hypothetical protein
VVGFSTVQNSHLITCESEETVNQLKGVEIDHNWLAITINPHKIRIMFPSCLCYSWLVCLERDAGPVGRRSHSKTTENIEPLSSVYQNICFQNFLSLLL